MKTTAEGLVKEHGLASVSQLLGQPWLTGASSPGGPREGSLCERTRWEQVALETRVLIHPQTLLGRRTSVLGLGTLLHQQRSFTLQRHGHQPTCSHQSYPAATSVSPLPALPKAASRCIPIQPPGGVGRDVSFRTLLCSNGVFCPLFFNVKTAMRTHSDGVSDRLGCR